MDKGKPGRPPEPVRCQCGKNSLHRAKLRAWDCCKAAGLMARVPRPGRKKGGKNRPKEKR
jgi:hypothetical protein